MIIDKKFLKDLKEKNYTLAYIKFVDIKYHQEKGINIPEIVLDLLEELGFDREEYGTWFLEDSITCLYHERKAFKKDDKYYDFNDDRNNHYIYTKDEYDFRLTRIKEEIEKSIKKSYVPDKSRNEIIYSVVNDLISQVARQSTEKLEYKVKTL